EEEPPEIEEPSEAEESAAADTAEEPPAEPPPAEPPPEGGPEPEVLGGAWYWIKRGDTLWDLSASFYRTPWHYGIIARWNGIENPDLIYTDSKIFIPEL
ncbi:MAG: LysM peptidoglycan-binding domain-containing protein, partial [bacterium]